MEAHLAARLAVLDAVVEAQRRMFRARSASEVAAAVADLVEGFGGTLVSPAVARPEALHVDVTFGTAPARIVQVAPSGAAAEQLREVLPALAEDARRAIGRLDHAEGARLGVGDDGGGRPFVILSEIGVPEAGAEGLEQAFRDRLGAVDGFEGFLGLQVWRDRSDRGRFVMVGWWRTREDYVAYMRSEAHERSHDRIPGEPVAPYPTGAGQFDVVAQ